MYENLNLEAMAREAEWHQAMDSCGLVDQAMSVNLYFRSAARDTQPRERRPHEAIRWGVDVEQP